MDSPQATLIPLAHLRGAGPRPGRDFEVGCHDVLVGKHGDHIGGEREAARRCSPATRRRRVHDRRQPPRVRREGTLSAGAHARRWRRPRLTTTATSRRSSTAPPAARDALRELLLAMSLRRPGGAAAARPRRGSRRGAGPHEGYAPLERAVDESGFYESTVHRRRYHLTGADYRSRAISALDRGAHLLSSARSGGLPLGGRLGVRGTRPGPRRPPARLVPRAGHELGDRRSSDGATRRLARAWSSAARRPTGAGTAPSGGRGRPAQPGRSRRAPAGDVGTGRARRAGRGGAPDDRLPPLAKREVWADEPPRLYRRRPPRSGTRPPRSTGTPRSSCADEVEDAVVQMMTYLDRERDGGAARARAVPRPGAPALPRGHAAARDPGRRRGAPHRGLHAARAAAAATRSGSRRAGGQASLEDAASTSPTSRSPPSCSRCSARARSYAAVVPRASRARPVHAAGRAARRAGRGAPRRVRAGAPGAVMARWTRACATAGARPSSAGTTRCAHGGPERGGVRRARPARRRRLGARGSRRGHAAVVACQARDGRRPPSAPRRLGFPAGEAEALSALHTRNFM